MTDAVVDDGFIVDSSSPEPAPAETSDAPPPAEQPPAPDPAADLSPDGVAEPAGTGDETSDKPEGDAAASDAAQKPGRKKSLQQRLDEVTWEREEHRRRAEAAEARLKERDQPTQPAPPQKAEKPPVDPNDPPPNVDQFESYEEFVDERAAWRARQEYRALRERDERAQADRAFQGRLAQLEQAATAQHADFVPTLEQFAHSGRSFAMNPFIHRVILEHDLGHEVAYALAADPATFDRIHTAPTFAHAVAEMGSLLARLGTAPTGSAPKVVTFSAAKPPISPVGSSPVAPEAGDDESFDAYVTRENAKERAARRR